MPTYLYECTLGHIDERVCTIAEMEAYEANIATQRCEAPVSNHPNGCGCHIHRILGVRRHIAFHEGFYEHTTENGVYCSSMQQLRSAAREAGNYSDYAENLGSAFGAKENRWI